MTETTARQQERRHSYPEAVRSDLARVALHQAREVAKACGEGGTQKAHRRTRIVAGPATAGFVAGA
ncbi:hypothetical protein [Streptomyces sp. NPDC090445]|uniref:hypothetical protein n=1 Tax=Streptomyces sp. NPDC090445 TaxID=3365963 RepID=UPI0038005563